MAAFDHLLPVKITQHGITPWQNVKVYTDLSNVSVEDLIKDTTPVTILAVLYSVDIEASISMAATFRRRLYSLSCHTENMITDIGDFLLTPESEDDFVFLVQYLVNKDSNLVVFNTSCDLKYLIYTAYQNINRLPVITNIDSHLELFPKNNSSNTFWSRLRADEKLNLAYYYNIATQEYFNTPNEIEFFNDSGLESLGLGNLRFEIDQAEPIMRMTNFLYFNTRALQGGYSACEDTIMPNGLRGEEVCHLARFAGLADGLNCFIIAHKHHTESPDFSMLMAQAAWYYITSLGLRKGEYPFEPVEKYQKYILYSSNIKQNLTFYNNPLSKRWWFEVPTKRGLQILPCTYEDYKMSTEGQVSERWWKWVVL